MKATMQMSGWEIKVAIAAAMNSRLVAPTIRAGDVRLHLLPRRKRYGKYSDVIKFAHATVYR